MFYKCCNIIFSSWYALIIWTNWKCYQVNDNFSHFPSISSLEIFNKLYPISWACTLKPKKPSSGTVMTDYLKLTWQPSQPILLLYPDAFPCENKRDYWHPRSIPRESYYNIKKFEQFTVHADIFYFGIMWSD